MNASQNTNDDYGYGITPMIAITTRCLAKSSELFKNNTNY